MVKIGLFIRNDYFRYGMLARVLLRNTTNRIMRWIYYLGMKMM
jgi:hypothetical protein